MKPYLAYKASGVPWLRKVPAHWTVQRLRFRCKMNPSVREGLNDSDVVSFLPMEAVGDDGSLNLEASRPVGDVVKGYTYFEDGDVTIAKITPCFENGKGAVMRGLQGGIGFGTTELIVTRPDDSVLPDWLYFLTQSDIFRKRGEAMMNGAGGQKRVPDLYVKDFPVAWPPVEEQQDIATYLERETTRIDTLIDEKGRLTDSLREYRHATISEVVTQGLDAAVRKKPSGVPWLGNMPAHWTIEKLKFFVRFVGGGTPSKDNDDYWDGDIPWVSPKDMKRPRIDDTEDKITEEAVGSSACTMIASGAVLVVVRSGILQHTIPIAVNDVPVAVNQDMKALIPNERMQSSFLAYQIQGCQRELREDWVKQGATVESIEQQRMADSRFAIPPLDEQDAIASYLDRETGRIDKLIEHVQDEIKLLYELRAATITDAVTGKIQVS